MSALDVRVARHVQEKVINGLLKPKCVILVTHQTHFLRERAKEVIVIEGGKVVNRGSYEQVFQIEGSVEEKTKPLAIDDIEVDSDSESRTNSKIKHFENSSTEKFKPIPTKEIRRSGSITWILFSSYLKTGNSVTRVLLIATLTIFTQVLLCASDIWLKLW